MKLAETLALINAGYSKAEIAAMESGEDVALQPEEKPAATVETPAAPAPAPAQAPDNEELLSAIKALTATLQKSNIRASSQPTAGGPVDPAEETRQKATDMLLTLCNT